MRPTVGVIEETAVDYGGSDHGNDKAAQQATLESYLDANNGSNADTSTNASNTNAYSTVPDTVTTVTTDGGKFSIHYNTIARYIDQTTYIYHRTVGNPYAVFKMAPITLFASQALRVLGAKHVLNQGSNRGSNWHVLNQGSEINLNSLHSQ